MSLILDAAFGNQKTKRTLVGILTNHFVVRCSMDFLQATNFSTWLDLAANKPRSGLGFCFCGCTIPVGSCNSEYQPR